MIRAASDLGASMICDHPAAIICDGKVLSDTEHSLSVSTSVRGMHGKGETNVGLVLLQSSDEVHVLSVALEWAGTESSAMAALHLLHKKCSGIKCLAKDPDYRCTQGTPLGQQTT